MNDSLDRLPTAARLWRVGWAVLLVTCGHVTGTSTHATDRFGDTLVEGFTQPYRTVEVAAPEMGIVTEMHVREGDLVKAGQLLATLDQELYRAQLAIAEKNVEAKGALESAKAELTLRNQRLEKLERLMERGHGSNEELERARTDVKVSEANLMTALDDHRLKQLELERIRVQIERLFVRARSDGVVTKVHKDVGEFVAPNDPVVVTVVQLNPLALILPIPRAQAMQIRVGQKVIIEFESAQGTAEAFVEYVSPVNDAESKTVAVRLKIDNTDGRLRSGEHCTLDMRSVAPRSPSQPLSKDRTSR